MAVLQIHGTADDTIAFGGETSNAGGTASYPGAEKTATTWARYDGCGGTPTDVGAHLDIDADVSFSGQLTETTVKRWTGCQPGGAVELWTMHDAGHVPNLSESFPAAVLGFLEAHPKP